jgi:hypothetical protein
MPVGEAVINYVELNFLPSCCYLPGQIDHSLYPPWSARGLRD